MMSGVGSTGSGQGQIETFCEHVYESSNIIKAGNFLTN